MSDSSASTAVQETQPFRLVYIYGAGHTGSTLLNLLLNGHSRVIGLSEAIHINDKHYMEDSSERRLFWQRVGARYESITGAPFSAVNLRAPRGSTALNWNRDQISRWARTNYEVFRAVADVSGKRIVVDSSKSWQRLYLLQRMQDMFDLRVIHLVRDGRGVVNSYLSKRKGFGRALRTWMSPSLMAFYLATRANPQRWLRVRYEDLAGDTTRSLDAICRLIGVDFEGEMLQYRSHPSVGVGGNGMRKAQTDHITLDVKWTRTLTASDLIKFNVAGGLLNWYYGYPMLPLRPGSRSGPSFGANEPGQIAKPGPR